jgi:hypothetical protein
MNKLVHIIIFLLLTFSVFAEQVEATNNGIANASPGDYIIRENGERVVLNQADIDYARNKSGPNITQKNNIDRLAPNTLAPDIYVTKTNFFQSFVLIFIAIILIMIFAVRKNKSRYITRKYPYNRENKTYIDQKGYRRFTDSDKLVHRYIVEKTLGRKLRSGEVVHHKNRNKLDNSPENLQVYASQDEHEKVHKESGWYI